MEEEEFCCPDDGYWVWQFGYPIEPPVGSRMFDRLQRHLRNAKGKLAIDISSVPTDKIPALLDMWFEAAVR